MVKEHNTWGSKEIRGELVVQLFKYGRILWSKVLVQFSKNPKRLLKNTANWYKNFSPGISTSS